MKDETEEGQEIDIEAVEFESDESEEAEQAETEDEALEEETEELEEEPESEDQETDNNEEGFFIQIGEEEAEKTEKETPVIKQIRNANRKLAKEKAELERKLAELKKPSSEVEVGKKPILDDYDFDEEKFADALLAWNDRKKQADAEYFKQQKIAEEANQAWTKKVTNYSDAKSRVRNDDFEAIEMFVMENLDMEQQSWIISSSDNPVSDVYLLGKSPEDLKKLSQIKDPARFIYELAKLNVSRGAKMKSKSTPKPEKRVKGSAPSQQANDTRLKKLEQEAALTGDRSKLIQYKRSVRK